MERAFTGIEDLRDMGAGEIPILMYHHVSTAPAKTRHAYLHVSSSAFERQMDELIDAGFQTRSLDFSERPAGGREIIITFDDGLENVFRSGLPKLINTRHRAIQFLVSDLIGRWNVWDENSGAARSRLMDASQIREWLAAGNEIGGHTRTHPHLTRLSTAQAREEITGCKKQLEDAFGCAVNHFCYPYGDWNEAVKEIVQEAGYQSACTVNPAFASHASDRFALPRLLAKQPRRSGFSGIIKDALERLFV